MEMTSVEGSGEGAQPTPCCLPPRFATAPECEDLCFVRVSHFVQSTSERDSKPFTEYRVRVWSRLANCSYTVYRRFSEFFELFHALQEEGIGVEAPFPSRSLFPVHDRQTLEYRRQLFDGFVQELVSRRDVLMVSHHVHVFLELHRLQEKALVPVDVAFSDDESDGDDSDGAWPCDTSISTAGVEDMDRGSVQQSRRSSVATMPCSPDANTTIPTDGRLSVGGDGTPTGPAQETLPVVAAGVEGGGVCGDGGGDASDGDDWVDVDGM